MWELELAEDVEEVAIVEWEDEGMEHGKHKPMHKMPGGKMMKGAKHPVKKGGKRRK